MFSVTLGFGRAPLVLHPIIQSHLEILSHAPSPGPPQGTVLSLGLPAVRELHLMPPGRTSERLRGGREEGEDTWPPFTSQPD